LRVEGEAQEPALATSQYAVGNIEERALHQRLTGQDADAARLLEDEQAPTAVAGVRDKHRRRQSCAYHRDKPDRCLSFCIGRCDCDLADHHGNGQDDPDNRLSD